MNLEKLDAHDVKVICQCINDYGIDEQPEATKETLHLFLAPYAKECMTKALGNNHIRTDIKVLLRQIKKRITN